MYSESPGTGKRRGPALPANAVCVYSNAQVMRALDSMADGLNAHYGDATVTAICVMNGGLIFSGHLLPRLGFDVRVDYCHATRYDNTTTGRELRWIAQPATPLAGRRILLLDDILDEGWTLKAIREHCLAAGATEVLSAVLLVKEHDRKAEGIAADFTALTVDDRYVFGFGMDYEGAYRHLDAIYAIDSFQG